MKKKKIITILLLVVFFTVFMSPGLDTTFAETNKETLYDFLKTTDKINAKYTYPSMKLSAASPNKVTLPAHTPVIIRCEETITTRRIVSGSSVRFSVGANVRTRNGLVLVKAGAPVTAQVTFAKSAGAIGRAGELTIEDFHTVAVDGSYIPLSGSLSIRADDDLVLSIVLSVILCPLFLLMRGDDARVGIGTTKTVFTVNDVYIRAESL